MTTEFSRLMDEIVLQQEAYTELLVLSRKKREVLTSSDVTALDLIIRAEEALLLQIGKIESERRRIAEEVAEAHGMKPEELTLSTWPGLTDEDRAQATSLQDAFRQTLGEMEEINRVNTKLLHAQLEYVHTLMNDVASIRESRSYAADGGLSVRKTQGNNLIDAIL